MVYILRKWSISFGVMVYILRSFSLPIEHNLSSACPCPHAHCAALPAPEQSLPPAQEVVCVFVRKRARQRDMKAKQPHLDYSIENG